MRLSISKIIQLFFEQSMYEYQMDWRPSCQSKWEYLWDTWLLNGEYVHSDGNFCYENCLNLHNKCIYLKEMFQVCWLTLFLWRKIVQMNFGMKHICTNYSFDEMRKIKVQVWHNDEEKMNFHMRHTSVWSFACT